MLAALLVEGGALHTGVRGLHVAARDADDDPRETPGDGVLTLECGRVRHCATVDNARVPFEPHGGAIGERGMRRRSQARRTAAAPRDSGADVLVAFPARPGTRLLASLGIELAPLEGGPGRPHVAADDAAAEPRQVARHRLFAPSGAPVRRYEAGIVPTERRTRDCGHDGQEKDGPRSAMHPAAWQADVYTPRSATRSTKIVTGGGVALRGDPGRGHLPRAAS